MVLRWLHRSAEGEERMPITDEQTALILEWTAANRQLQFFKAEEMRLRLLVVSALANPANVKGTENINLGNEWRLKVVKKEYYNLKNPSNNGLVNTLQGCFSEEIRNTLVRWLPELSVSVYNTLPDEQKALLTPFLTIKPGAPEVELIGPADKL
jgi:hypothetical protein